MEFTKAHGTGNDFVVIADLDARLDLTPALVRALCDRRTGIGADGVLRVIAASSDADAFMDHRNADGSIAEMCGNGVRVVAKYLADHGHVPDRDVLVIDTRAGLRPVRITRDDEGRAAMMTVDMGPPSFGPEGVDVAVTVEGHALQLTPVSMGNPHAVVVVDDVDAAPVTTLGPAIASLERFPEGTNVEFVAVGSPHEVHVRVWERGVGETAACGTGACAATVALRHLGLVRDRVHVYLPGGALEVAYAPSEHDSVFLTGPAVEVARGRLDAQWLASAQRGERG